MNERLQPGSFIRSPEAGALNVAFVSGPMYDPLYEEAQRLDVALSVHGNRSSSAEVGAGA